MKYKVSLPRKMIEEIQTIMLTEVLISLKSLISEIEDKKLVKLLTSYKCDRREWSSVLE